MEGKRTRPVQLKFYVTEEEKEFIKYKMSLMNVTNQSAYLRKMAVDGMLVQVDYSQFDDIAKSIEHISRNINLIAKRILSTDTIYPGDMREIQEKQEEIWKLLKKIFSKI